MARRSADRRPDKTAARARVDGELRTRSTIPVFSDFHALEKHHPLLRRARPASTRERRAPARAYAIPTRSSRVRAPSSSPRAAVCAARASGSRGVLLRDEKRPRLPKRTAVCPAVCPSCRARPTRHASTPEVRRARYPPIRRASASLLPPHASVLGRARPVQRALARERFHRRRFLDDA